MKKMAVNSTWTDSFSLRYIRGYKDVFQQNLFFSVLATVVNWKYWKQQKQKSDQAFDTILWYLIFFAHLHVLFCLWHKQPHTVITITVCFIVVPQFVPHQWFRRPSTYLQHTGRARAKLCSSPLHSNRRQVGWYLNGLCLFFFQVPCVHVSPV